MSQDTSGSHDLRPELLPVFRLVESGQYDMARLRLQRHLQDHPQDPQGLFLFGLSFHRQHRYDQARRHFDSALELDRQYPPLHYFRGWCLYHLGQLDGALESFQTHLRFDENEPDTHFGVGLIALQQDRLDDAQQHFTRTIELHAASDIRSEDLGRAHGKLGEVHARRGDLSTARQHLETASELYPDDHESLYQLYRVLLQLGETDAAEDARQRHMQARQRAGLPGSP